MSLTVNTNIVNDTDQYLLDAKNVKGGYIVVETINKRDTLPTATIMNGSLCYCQEDSKFYQYDGTNWIEAVLGGKVDKLIIGDGEANGLHSIAGGSTNSSIVDNYVGTGIASSAINLSASDAKGNMSIALGAGIQDVKVLGVTLMPGQKNIAYSDASIALGLGNISGGKGYYVSAINTTDKTLTLSTTQKSATAPTTAPSWKAGDRLFFENDNRHFLEVAEDTTNSIVKVKELPFKSLASFSTYTKPTERAIINITQPESGEVTLGFGAIGIGAQNISVGSGAYAVGYKNVVAGAYGAAFGQENQVGYSAFAAGILNNALGKAALAIGDSNTAKGYYSQAFGHQTLASGKCSLAIGDGCVASGDSSVALGEKTKATKQRAVALGYVTSANADDSVAMGNDCHTYASSSFCGGLYSKTSYYGTFVYGRRLKSSRSYQAVFGEENVDNKDALLIVGTSEPIGGNAFEVLDNGILVSKSTTCKLKIRVQSSYKGKVYVDYIYKGVHLTASYAFTAAGNHNFDIAVDKCTPLMLSTDVGFIWAQEGANVSSNFPWYGYIGFEYGPHTAYVKHDDAYYTSSCWVLASGEAYPYLSEKG